MTNIRNRCIVRRIGRGKTQVRKICFDANGNIKSNAAARKTKRKTNKRRRK